MVQLSNHDERLSFHKAQKERILSVFKRETEKTAVPISKAEFEERFPTDKFEVYTLAKINAYREDIMKAEGVEDPEGAFKKAVADLQHFVVQDGDNVGIAFVREKEKGE